jgi:hypothetical protein
MTYEIWIKRRGSPEWEPAERRGSKAYAEATMRKYVGLGFKVAIYGPFGARFYGRW